MHSTTLEWVVPAWSPRHGWKERKKRPLGVSAFERAGVGSRVHEARVRRVRRGLPALLGTEDSEGNACAGHMQAATQVGGTHIRWSFIGQGHRHRVADPRRTAYHSDLRILNAVIWQRPMGLRATAHAGGWPLAPPTRCRCVLNPGFLHAAVSSPVLGIYLVYIVYSTPNGV